MGNRKKIGSSIKQMNKSRIYHMIYKGDGVSRQDIASQLDLSLPTVNQNLKQLLEEELIAYEGTFASTGGRKAQTIVINPDARMSVGMYLTKNTMRIVLLNLKGETRVYEKIKIPFAPTQEYGQAAAENAYRIVKKYGGNQSSLLGVGIVVPGIFDDKMQNVTAPSLCTHSFPASFLTGHFSCPTIFENDANAGGYAELQKQPELAAGPAVYLSVEKGVGGAFFWNNSIYRGKHHHSGEFGHMKMESRGKICRCGQRGCLEAYISTAVLSDDLDCQLEEFFGRLKKEDKRYQEIWKAYLTYLCSGIHNIYMCYDCDVILGGAITQYLDEHEESIRRKLASLNPYEKNADYFRLSKYRSNAPAVGAALQQTDRFLEKM